MKKSFLFLFTLVICFSFASCDHVKKAAGSLFNDKTEETDSEEAEDEAEEEAPVVTIKTFCEPFTADGFDPGYNFRDQDAVIKSLEDEGFTIESRKEMRHEEICGSDESWMATVYTCTKKTPAGTTTVLVDPGDDIAAQIIFPSEAAADAFIKSARNVGYKINREQSDSEGTYYSNPSNCYFQGTNLSVKNNVVSLITIWEC